jgi:hypothetical protein
MMNPDEILDPDAETLLALRSTTDAVRVITEHLKVKEMGPADHIRTKHEVKTFVETAGSARAAEELLKRARERREVNQSVTMRNTLQRGQRMAD